jgi:hypothetical protein
MISALLSCADTCCVQEAGGINLSPWSREKGRPRRRAEKFSSRRQMLLDAEPRTGRPAREGRGRLGRRALCRRAGCGKRVTDQVLSFSERVKYNKITLLSFPSCRSRDTDACQILAAGLPERLVVTRNATFSGKLVRGFWRIYCTAVLHNLHACSELDGDVVNV